MQWAGAAGVARRRPAHAKSSKAAVVPELGGRFLISAVLIVATISAAIAALVVVSGSVTGGPRASLDTRHPSTSLPSGPPALRHAVQWISGNLPSPAPVLADRRVARALRARGFVDVLPATFGPADGTPAYVVETPAIRAAAGSSHAVRAALEASAPVARFGDIVVRQHVDVGPRELARAQAADARARLALERRLLGDRRLTMAPDARRVLHGGGLDLRAATALSLLARRGPVRLVAAPVVPAENAVGLPARAIVVHVRAGLAAAVLQQLSLPYRPASVRRMRDGLQRWTWSVRGVE